MNKKYFNISFSVQGWVIDILENTAELARLETKKDVTPDDVAKAIIMRTIGKCGEEIVY